MDDQIRAVFPDCRTTSWSYLRKTTSVVFAGRASDLAVMYSSTIGLETMTWHPTVVAGYPFYAAGIRDGASGPESYFQIVKHPRRAADLDRRAGAARRGPLLFFRRMLIFPISSAVLASAFHGCGTQ